MLLYVFVLFGLWCKSNDYVNKIWRKTPPPSMLIEWCKTRRILVDIQGKLLETEIKHRQVLETDVRFSYAADNCVIVAGNLLYVLFVIKL